MRCVFMLASEYGLKCLQEIIDNVYIHVVGIVTTNKEFELRYGQGMRKKMINAVYDKLVDISKELKIPVYAIQKMNSPETIYQLQQWNPEIIVVSGWYHLIGSKILQMPRYGVIGLHSSLLPKYRGGAPLVWQMINGEEYTGITLFYMDEGVDSGDIIGQKRIKIEYLDTINTLYNKVDIEGIKLLKEGLNNIAQGRIVRRKQYNLREEDIYPQRNPTDGVINWKQSSNKIYDFVRAQTKPYPGAYFVFGKYKIIVWACEIVKKEISLLTGREIMPGTVLEIANDKSSYMISTCDEEKMIKVVDCTAYDERGQEINISECNLEIGKIL